MRFVVVCVLIAGCAHAPSSFMPQAAPGDERALVAEFCVAWEPACQRFQREVLTDAGVQQALARVRFVQFDYKDVKGGAAYEHFEQAAMARDGTRLARLLVFLAVVDGRAVRRYAGAPYDRRAFIAFLDDVAGLGGNEQAVRDDVAAAPGDPARLMRAARWYEARQREDAAQRYWEHTRAAAGDNAALAAEADWHIGRTNRNSNRHEARVALTFAHDHAGTVWGLRALAVAIVHPEQLAAAEIEPVIRETFARLRDEVDATYELAWDALAAGLRDLALTIAQQGVRLTHSQSPRELDTLAQVYYAMGQIPAASSLLQQALEIAPDNPQLKRDLDRLHSSFGPLGPGLLVWQTAARDWARLFYGEE